MPAAEKLYWAPGLPDRWVTEEGGSLVAWPARADGWRERSPYLGQRGALREASPRNAIGTGWPGATAAEAA